MIEIHGLSKQQREIADMIWSLDTTEEVVEWFGTLDNKTLIEAYVVHQLICLAYLDNEPLGRMKEANQIIDRIRHI